MQQREQIQHSFQGVNPARSLFVVFCFHGHPPIVAYIHMAKNRLSTPLVKPLRSGDLIGCCRFNLIHCAGGLTKGFRDSFPATPLQNMHQRPLSRLVDR